MWPDINKDVLHWLNHTSSLQMITVHHHTVTPQPTPEIQFNHVHIDIKGPLLASQGNSYILVIVLLDGPRFNPCQT